MGAVPPELLAWGSLVVTALACASAWLLRRRNRAGWRLMKYEQVLWAAYGLVTYQFTFILSAAWYFWQSDRALRSWRPPLSAAELDRVLVVVAEKVRAAEPDAAGGVLRDALVSSGLDVPQLELRGQRRRWVVRLRMRVVRRCRGGR